MTSTKRLRLVSGAARLSIFQSQRFVMAILKRARVGELPPAFRTSQPVMPIFRRKQINKCAIFDVQNFWNDTEAALAAELDQHIIRIASAIGWHIVREVLLRELNMDYCSKFPRNIDGSEK